MKTAAGGTGILAKISRRITYHIEKKVKIQKSGPKFWVRMHFVFNSLQKCSSGSTFLTKKDTSSAVHGLPSGSRSYDPTFRQTVKKFGLRRHRTTSYGWLFLFSASNFCWRSIAITYALSDGVVDAFGGIFHRLTTPGSRG